MELLESAAYYAVRDIRRIGRQLWRQKTKDLKRFIIASFLLGLLLTILLVVETVIGVGIILLLWMITLPSRIMTRPLWNGACRDSELDNPPHIVPGSIRHKPYGVKMTVYLRAGQSKTILEGRLEKIAASLGAMHVTIE